MITILLYCLRKLSLLYGYDNISDIPPLLVSYPCSAYLHRILHSIIQNDVIMLVLSCDTPLPHLHSSSTPLRIKLSIMYEKDENVPHILYIWEESKFSEQEGWRWPVQVWTSLIWGAYGTSSQRCPSGIWIYVSLLVLPVKQERNQANLFTGKY